MGIVVKFGGRKGTGMECNRMDFVIRECNGENCGNSIIRRIGFNCDRGVGDPVG